MNDSPKVRRSRWRSGRTKWVAALIVIVIATLVSRLQVTDGRLIDLSWDYDFRPLPRCTEQQRGSCIVGFNVFVGPPEQRPEQRFVPVSVVGSTVNRLSTTVAVRATGTVVLCVAAVAKTETDFYMESSPVCTERWIAPVKLKTRIPGTTMRTEQREATAGTEHERTGQ